MTNEKALGWVASHIAYEVYKSEKEMRECPGMDECNLACIDTMRQVADALGIRDEVETALELYFS